MSTIETLRLELDEGTESIGYAEKSGTDTAEKLDWEPSIFLETDEGHDPAQRS